MPGLPFETMPGAQQTEEPIRQGTQIQNPAQRMESQFNQQRQYLHRQWQIDAEAIDNTWFADRGKWQTAVAKLTANYRKKELELQQVHEQQQQEQQQKQQYIMGLRGRKKALTDVELYQAQRRLTGEEERFAQLPVEGRPLTPAQLASPSMSKVMGVFIEVAPTIKKWNLRAKDEPKTGKGLLDAYREWKDHIQYDLYNPVQQRQMDQVWDLHMGMDERFKAWQSKKVQVDLKALRSRGRIGDAMKDRMVGKSSIGRSFETLTARQKRAQYFKGIRGPQESTPQGQLPRPTSQTEYNRVSSGSQYIGTDGQIRTKR